MIPRPTNFSSEWRSFTTNRNFLWIRSLTRLYDKISTHFLLRLTPSLTVIGTIRASKLPGTNRYKLSRLAVRKDYRKFGFGREMVSALHDWVAADARQRGETRFAEIISHSQIPAKGFYAKFGYESEGAEFDEDGDPHQKMVLRLPL